MIRAGFVLSALLVASLVEGQNSVPSLTFEVSALANGGTDASNNAIFQAVQKLGLRLQPVKAPFDSIVVDHLEKTPTEN